MLGLAPISARPISGGPFGIVVISAPMVAALSLSLAVSGRPGVYQPMAAGIQMSFSLSGPMKINQSIAGNISLGFTLSPRLLLAGKPLKFAAIPESFDFRAANENWSLKALPQDFTARTQ